MQLNRTSSVLFTRLSRTTTHSRRSLFTCSKVFNWEGAVPCLITALSDLTFSQFHQSEDRHTTHRFGAWKSDNIEIHCWEWDVTHFTQMCCHNIPSPDLIIQSELSAPDPQVSYMNRRNTSILTASSLKPHSSASNQLNAGTTLKHAKRNVSIIFNNSSLCGK